MLIEFRDLKPRIAENVFIAPGAYIIGNVILEAYSSVWFNAVIRGDMDVIHIGSETNIQDNCSVHTDEGYPSKIGSRVTVGHNSVLHGCLIEDEALIGMGAVILNGARIGRGAIIGAGAVVTSGTVIPAGTLAVGSPAKVIRNLESSAARNDGREKAYQAYTRIAGEYRQ